MGEYENLPKLPRGWGWATVKQLASTQPRSIQSGPFGSNLKHSEFQDVGILAIGIDNVLNGQFFKGKQNRISHEKYVTLEKYTARPLDVLITVMATVGRCCVVPEDIETAIITKHVYRITVNQEIIYPYYLMFALLGGQTVKDQIKGQTRGQTRPGINGTILKNISIPIPPLTEQHRIVNKIEELFTQLDAGVDLLKKLKLKLKRYRQAVLKAAVEGKLTQDWRAAHQDEL
ncbi:restriction endonuclease subunit S, partial [Adonisia turfae]